MLWDVRYDVRIAFRLVNSCEFQIVNSQGWNISQWRQQLLHPYHADRVTLQHVSGTSRSNGNISVPWRHMFSLTSVRGIAGIAKVGFAMCHLAKNIWFQFFWNKNVFFFVEVEAVPTWIWFFLCPPGHWMWKMTPWENTKKNWRNTGAFQLMWCFPMP